MKKFKKILFVVLFSLFIPIASAGSFSATSTDLSPTVGSTIRITVNASNSAGKFVVSSSNPSVLSGGGSSWIENGSGTFSFTAKSAGSATVTIKADDVSDSSDGSSITGSKTITITVKNPSSNSNSGGSVVKKTAVKSSINYLTSLSIDGVELVPSFDKETTEYDVILESGTSSVTVNGTKESSVSYVTGLGSVAVSEGVNFISVVVTAENGAKRTYNIRATVLEESPIIVDINGSDKTLIRKSDALPSVSDYYNLGTVLIDDVEIPAYVSEITGYTLVGLKDDSGNVSLYRYQDNSYFKYDEFGFSSVRIGLLKPNSIPKGYELSKVSINEKDVDAYVKDGSLPLIYGINIENGKEGFYSYDSSENTIQKFIVPKECSLSKYYPYIIIFLGSLSLFEFIVIICIVVSKNKKLKKALYNKLDVNKQKKGSKDSIDSSIDVENLGHTALISKSVSNVYDNTKNKKDSKKEHKKKSKKNSDDDMFQF